MSQSYIVRLVIQATIEVEADSIEDAREKAEHGFNDRRIDVEDWQVMSAVRAEG